MGTSYNNIVKINVGGRIFETSRDTLLLSGVSSKLQELMGELDKVVEKKDSATAEAGPGLGSGEKHEIFFDRDPECFEHILFYLRTASLAGVRDLGTVEKLKIESEFYGLGQGFQELLKGKERCLNLTLKETSNNVRKDLDMRKTFIVRLQIELSNVEDYVKWDIERNENIIRIAIGHRTQCSTQMRYQVTQGDTYNLQMTLTITTRVNETNRERLEKHIVKSVQSQFSCVIHLLSLEELTHCSYCERLLPNVASLPPAQPQPQPLSSPSTPRKTPHTLPSPSPVTNGPSISVTVNGNK